jgi:hypothetical protein
MNDAKEVFTVKLCDQCPYTPEDLVSNETNLYDPASEYFCCGQCPETPVYRPPGIAFPRDDRYGKQGRR